MGVGVFLGEALTPGLADLTESERVLLVEPNELRANSLVRTMEVDGRCWWFA
jgi:hypothetical protein